MKTKIIVFVSVVALTACATKRYPIAVPLSASEAEVMTCKDLQIEMARLDEVEHQINETSEFDTRTVLGGLGDLGIGNRMAQNEARAALTERRSNVRDAQVRKGCAS